MLPPEAIKEFKELYKKRFGVDLIDQEASFRANNLVGLYEAVYGESFSQNFPNNKKWLKTNYFIYTNNVVPKFREILIYRYGIY